MSAAIGISVEWEGDIVGTVVELAGMPARSSAAELIEELEDKVIGLEEGPWIVVCIPCLVYCHLRCPLLLAGVAACIS